MAAIRNILEKPEESLKRDLVFTDSTFTNLNMKKYRSKEFYGHVQWEYGNIENFSFLHHDISIYLYIYLSIYLLYIYIYIQETIEFRKIKRPLYLICILKNAKNDPFNVLLRINFREAQCISINTLFFFYLKN